MSESINVGATIAPKSDQLNADDLIAGPITVRIASVTKGNADCPIAVRLEGRLPYYPCKSMRRVLVAAWGEDGAAYAGRYLTLYRDPEVKYGGIKVGGIRISHMSDITSDLHMALTVTRGKRAEYTVQRLDVAPAKAPKPKPAPAAGGYPADKFEADLPRMHAAIASGKSTFQQIVDYAESNTGKLSDEQKHRIATMPQEA
jgi:hypothetical protein